MVPWGATDDLRHHPYGMASAAAYLPAIPPQACGHNPLHGLTCSAQTTCDPNQALELEDGGGGRGFIIWQLQ